MTFILMAANVLGYKKPNYSVFIDENLTWKKKDNVCKLCASNIGVLKKG